MIDIVTKTINQMDFDKEFIVDNINNLSFTYNNFFERALMQAVYLEKNVREEDIIVIMENSFDLALLYFSVLLTSKRILVVDPQKGSDEIGEILETIPKTAIIYDDGLLMGKNLYHYRIKNNYEKSYAINDIKSEVLVRLEQRNEKRPYLVTFTSGTSGVTKGVEHTFDNLIMSAKALDEKVGKHGGTFLHVMPMTYMAGILNSIFYPFLVGARIVINKRFSIASAREFWNVVVKYNVDLFWLSPSMLMMIDQMDRKSEGEEYCKSHQLIFLIGTAPLTNELRTKFQKRYSVSMYASYGLTETLFISVETKYSQTKSEKNCVGELLNGVEYSFSESNEIYINVPWMYLKYTNENTDKYFVGEYYKSGDLAKVRDECLYITGRSKDLIIKGGMNISPALIEQEIYKNEAILENVVIGVKDTNGEEKICCAYILNCEVDDLQDFEAGIKRMVIGSLGKNYSVDFMWKVDVIPRNINGKVDKNEMAREWVKKNGK